MRSTVSANVAINSCAEWLRLRCHATILAVRWICVSVEGIEQAGVDRLGIGWRVIELLAALSTLAATAKCWAELLFDRNVA